MWISITTPISSNEVAGAFLRRDGSWARRGLPWFVTSTEKSPESVGVLGGFVINQTWSVTVILRQSRWEEIY